MRFDGSNRVLRPTMRCFPKDCLEIVSKREGSGRDNTMNECLPGDCNDVEREVEGATQ